MTATSRRHHTRTLVAVALAAVTLGAGMPAFRHDVSQPTTSSPSALAIQIETSSNSRVTRSDDWANR